MSFVYCVLLLNIQSSASLLFMMNSSTLPQLGATSNATRGHAIPYHVIV